MTGAATSPGAVTDGRSALRWQIALLVSAAIAISYLDRQTLPWAIKAIQADIPIGNEVKAFLDSTFLVDTGGDRFRIAMYMPHQDIMQVIKERGILKG